MDMVVGMARKKKEHWKLREKFILMMKSEIEQKKRIVYSRN